MMLLNFYLSEGGLLTDAIMAMVFLWHVQHKSDLGVVMTIIGLYLSHTLQQVL